MNKIVDKKIVIYFIMMSKPILICSKRMKIKINQYLLHMVLEDLVWRIYKNKMQNKHNLVKLIMRVFKTK